MSQTLACALLLGCTGAPVAEPGPAEGTEQQDPDPVLVYDARVEKSLTTTSLLMAIPVSRIGLEEPKVFYETPERFPLNEFKYWSPNGDILIFDEGWFELSDATWENRLLFSQADRGQLTPPRLVPELPSGGSYSLDDFDVVTNTALISRRDELYSLRFEGDEPTASLVLRSDDSFDAWLCRGASHVIQHVWGAAGAAEIMPLGATGASAVSLGLAYAIEPSPDRSYVAVTAYSDDESYTVSVGSCSLEPELTPVAQSDEWVDFAWSPDSRRLLLAGTSGDSSWHKVIALDGSIPGEVLFEGEGLFSTALWSPDGDMIALLSATTSTWWLLRIAEQSFEPLPSDVVYVSGWVDRYLIATSDEGDSLVVIDTSSGADPLQILAADGGDIADLIIEADGKRFACVRSGDMDELFVVDPSLGADGVELVYSGPTVPPLLAFPGAELGVLASVDDEEVFELWWFPLGPDVAREPIIYSPAEFPALQPVP